MTSGYLNEMHAYSITVQATYFFCLGFIRASVIAFILRLEQLPKIVRINLWALSVINVALLISILFADIFQCGPNLVWDFDFPLSIETVLTGRLPSQQYHCIQTSSLLLSAASISVGLDFWVLLIPSFIVKGMNMPLKQKCMVVAILGMGAMLVYALSRYHLSRS